MPIVYRTASPMYKNRNHLLHYEGQRFGIGPKKKKSPIDVYTNIDNLRN